MAEREDVYQSLPYAAATGLRRVTLIYGAESDGARYLQIVDERTVLQVRTVNLAAPLDLLHARMAALAVEIVRQTH